MAAVQDAHVICIIVVVYGQRLIKKRGCKWEKKTKEIKFQTLFFKYRVLVDSVILTLPPALKQPFSHHPPSPDLPHLPTYFRVFPISSSVLQCVCTSPSPFTGCQIVYCAHAWALQPSVLPAWSPGCPLDRCHTFGHIFLFYLPAWSLTVTHVFCLPACLWVMHLASNLFLYSAITEIPWINDLQSPHRTDSGKLWWAILLFWYFIDRLTD